MPGWLSAGLAVFVAGGAGALLRWGLDVGGARWLGSGFGWGVAASNLLGSLAFGLIWAYWASRGASALSPTVRAAVLIGFLGAFTTFSTFAAHVGQAMTQGRWWLAAGTLALHNVGGIAAALLGMAAGRALAGGGGAG
ncbi:MAG: CrcB family protein [Planctomycetota bacterium]